MKAARRRRRVVLPLAFTACCLAAGPARSDEPERGAEGGGTPAVTPYEVPAPAWEPRFTEAVRLEDEERFAEAARVFEEVAAGLPGESHPRWRAARAWVRAGARLPLAQKEQRLALFERADREAAAGVAADAACAECYLYRFVALSRAATTRGIFSAARHAGEMADLLARAEELEPTHVDAPWNQELGNLYFAAGVLYRVLPDSALAQMTLGVRGDPARALSYLRRAVALTPSRIDYRMELAATLLCQGRREKEDEPVAEGRELLASVDRLPVRQWSDPVDQVHAEVLRAEPARACDYGREEWLAEGIGAEATSPAGGAADPD